MKLIIFQKKLGGRNAHGETLNNWSNVSKHYGKVKSLNATSQEDSDTSLQLNTIQISLRFSRKVAAYTHKMRVLIDGTPLKIDSIENPDFANRTLEFFCSAYE